MRFRDHQPALPDGLPTGPRNLITDVAGLRVGHCTVTRDEPQVLRTGVSVLEIAGVRERPVAAGVHVFNGFGKSMGLMQIEEVGSIESPLYFTNTLSVGAVHQGAIRRVLRERPDVRTFSPVVLECNDGILSEIGALAITPEMVDRAHEDAREDFAQGSVGAGTGMTCFGFKGGIGSASRALEIEGEAFRLGALVLTNFGQRADLRLPGLDTTFAAGEESGAGSLIMVLATDLPLMPHQLARTARHMSQAIGLLGAVGHPCSGDIAVAFSTSLRDGGETVLQERLTLVNDTAALHTIFRAATWATVEAILDSMFTSPTVKGVRGEAKAIVEALGISP